MKGKTIGILGLAFKAETDDTRESPAIVIINELLKKGAKVKTHDPQAKENARKVFGDSIEYYDNEYKVLKDIDALVILTEWNQYRGLDLEIVKKLMKGKTVLDTRNLLNKEEAMKLEFNYEGVGR